MSSPSYSEATPAIWGSTVVFTRRVTAATCRTSRTSSSSASSRRLLKNKCVQTDAGHASIRGTRIIISSVDTSGADANGAGLKVAELRKYSAKSSGSQVMATQNFGEESNLFGQVAQDDHFAYTVRVGIHPANTFMRISYASGKPEEVRAFRTLTDGFAKPAANSSLYVEEQGGEDATACDGFTDIPCRIVFAPAVPFGGAQRTLTPQLTVAYEGQPQNGQPLPFSGTLTQQVVSGNSVVSTTPLAGVSVGLYHRTGSSPERFEDTGLKAVTGADGSYRIVAAGRGGRPVVHRRGGDGPGADVGRARDGRQRRALDATARRRDDLPRVEVLARVDAVEERAEHRHSRRRDVLFEPRRVLGADRVVVRERGARVDERLLDRRLDHVVLLERLATLPTA